MSLKNVLTDVMNKKLTGAELIAQERRRQIEVEGWSKKHDKQHKDGELMRAALCYFMRPFFSEDEQSGKVNYVPREWPWAEDYWKPLPENRVRELVKAGALFQAQYERDKGNNDFAEAMVRRCGKEVDRLLNS